MLTINAYPYSRDLVGIVQPQRTPISSISFVLFKFYYRPSIADADANAAVIATPDTAAGGGGVDADGDTASS